MAQARKRRRRKRGESEGQFLRRCAKLDQDAARKERQRSHDRSELRRAQPTRIKLERERTAATKPTTDPIYVRAFPDGESWADATEHLEATRIANESYEKWQNRFSSFADNVSEDGSEQDSYVLPVRGGVKKCVTDHSEVTCRELDPTVEGTTPSKLLGSHDDALRNFVEILGVGPEGEILGVEGSSSPTPPSISPPLQAPALVTKITIHIKDLTHLSTTLKLDAPRAVLTNTRARERGRSLFASAGCEPFLLLPEPPKLKQAIPVPPPSAPAATPVAPHDDEPVAPPAPQPSVLWHETIIQAVLVRWLKRVRQETRGLVAVRLSLPHRLQMIEAYDNCRAAYHLQPLGRLDPLPSDCPAFALMMGRTEEALRLIADVSSSDGLIQIALYVCSAPVDESQLVRCRMALSDPSAVHRAYRETVRTEIEAGRLAVLVDERRENEDERRAS